MAETQTPNFKWIKPDIGGDSTTWGNVLNTIFDNIDSVAWANQNAGTGIGAIQMYGGVTPPPNWMWCNGGVYLDSDVPALAPVLKPGGTGGFPGSDATHTAVPLLWSGRGPVGYDGSGWAMGAAGGESNHTITTSEMPVHSHPGSMDSHNHPGSYQDVHVHYAWQDGHAHGVGNTQAHSHVVVTGNHSHGIATGGHSHGASLMRFIGGSGQPLGVHGGIEANTTYGNTDGAGNLGGNTDTAGNLGGYTDTQALAVGNTDTRQPGTYVDNRQPAVYVAAQQPGVYVGNAGGGAGANNMAPYTVVGFIIRYK